MIKKVVKAVIKTPIVIRTNLLKTILKIMKQTLKKLKAYQSKKGKTEIIFINKILVDYHLNI